LVVPAANAGDPREALSASSSLQRTLLQQVNALRARHGLPRLRPATGLGEAAGAGSLVLELGAGASLVCTARNGKGAIGGWLVGIDPTQLVVIAGGTGPASLTGYGLWPATPPATVRSAVGWFNPAGFIASLRATPGQEVVGLSGFANGFLDRPLAVDGGALPMAGNGSLFLTVTATTTTLAILAAPATPPTQSFSLALENALIGVHAPRFFLVTGPLANPSTTQLTSATATILLDARWLVPTLPATAPDVIHSGRAALLRERTPEAD